MNIDKRLATGILIVVVGTFLLLDNLRLIPYELYFLRSWQMLLIVIGAFNLVTGRRSAAIVLFAIGGFFLIEDYGPYDFRDFWPVILIAVGAVFILRRKDDRPEITNDDNYFDEINVFGGGDQKIASTQLEGGKITNIFGGTNIDLRDSYPVDGAVIEVFTVFGGCELIMPDDWKVKIEAFSLFGGFSDNRGGSGPNPDSPMIRIKGFTIFGGGEIKSR